MPISLARMIFFFPCLHFQTMDYKKERNLLTKKNYRLIISWFFSLITSHICTILNRECMYFSGLFRMFYILLYKKLHFQNLLIHWSYTRFPFWSCKLRKVSLGILVSCVYTYIYMYLSVYMYVYTHDADLQMNDLEGKLVLNLLCILSFWFLEFLILKKSTCIN